MLDNADRDPDLEPNGDERDGSGAEDDFCDHSNSERYPGWPISDPDAAIDDGPCDEPYQYLEEEYVLAADYGVDQTHALPEAMVINSDRQQMREHRNRIRRDQCVPRYRHTSRGTLIESRDEFILIHGQEAPTRRQLLKRKRGVPHRPRA